MSSSQKMRGSAHVIIIIVLIVALLATLGFVFYQNVIAKNQATTSKTEGTTSGTSKSTTTRFLTASLSDGFDGVKLSFNYPADWSFSRTTTGPLPIVSMGDITRENLTVTSPSGKFSLTYHIVSSDGFGGACVPEETGMFVKTNYQVLDKFSGVSYLEYTTTTMPVADDGAHTIGRMTLVKTDAAEKSVSGASVCEVSFAGIIPLNTSGVTLLAPDVKIAGVKTAEEFTASATGTEYDQAKAILLSTVH